MNTLSLFKFSYIQGLDSFVQVHDKNYFWSCLVTFSYPVSVRAPAFALGWTGNTLGV